MHKYLLSTLAILSGDSDMNVLLKSKNVMILTVVMNIKGTMGAA